MKIKVSSFTKTDVTVETFFKKLKNLNYYSWSAKVAMGKHSKQLDLLNINETMNTGLIFIDRNKDLLPIQNFDIVCFGKQSPLDMGFIFYDTDLFAFRILFRVRNKAGVTQMFLHEFVRIYGTSFKHSNAIRGFHGE